MFGCNLIFRIDSLKSNRLCAGVLFGVERILLGIRTGLAVYREM